MKRIIAFLLTVACLFGFSMLLTGCKADDQSAEAPQKLSLSTNHKDFLSITVSSREKDGCNRSYTTEGKIQVFVEYFNSLELVRAFNQKPDQTGAEVYEITLQNADDSKAVLYRANNLLREGDGPWLEMTAEQSAQFDALLQKHLSDAEQLYKGATVTTKTGDIELPVYFSYSTKMHEIDGEIHWFHADGYGFSELLYNVEEKKKIPILKSSDVLSLNLPVNMTNPLQLQIYKGINMDGATASRNKTWEDLQSLPKGEWFITFVMHTQGRYSVEEERHEDAFCHCVFYYVVE